MARYIDKDALGIGKADRNAFEIPQYADGWNSAIEIIANAPTADVVPRAEVALEVIGEVEKMARDYIDGIMLLDPQNTYCFGGINAFENVIKFLAELKKKYTED